MAFKLHAFRYDRPLFIDSINPSPAGNRGCFFPARAHLTDAGGECHVDRDDRDVLARTTYRAAPKRNERQRFGFGRRRLDPFRTRRLSSKKQPKMPLNRWDLVARDKLVQMEG